MSAILENIMKQASLLNKRIILPEGEDSRVVVAASETVKEGFARVVVLGNPEEIKKNNPDVCLDGVEIIDAEGLYVGPGLIDVHTHAADNMWIFEQPEKTSKHLMEHGVTSVLPALYNNLNKDAYISAIDSIEKAHE